MSETIIKTIIAEELRTAEIKIWSRIYPILKGEGVLEDNEAAVEKSNQDIESVPFPANPNYRQTFELSNQGESLPSIAKVLGVSLATVTRYYRWLANNGYIDIGPSQLTPSEEQAVRKIFEKGLSLTEVAEQLNFSAPYVSNLRDAALSKGYLPPFFVKILFPSFYKFTNNPTINFPMNRGSLARQINVGQQCFIYLTSPEKKVIALVEVVSDMREVGGRWPFEFDVKFVISPKHGITLKEAGISFRPRPGDTHIPIDVNTASRIMKELRAQPDLPASEIARLASIY